MSALSLRRECVAYRCLRVRRVLRSIARSYGRYSYRGSGVGNMGEVEAAPASCHGRRHANQRELGSRDR